MQTEKSLAERFLADMIVPLFWTIVFLLLFIGASFGFTTLVVNGISAFSEALQDRLSTMGADRVSKMVDGLRETIQYRFNLAAIVAFLAALLWYAYLFLFPAWRPGQSRGRRIIWAGFLSIAVVIVALTFLATAIPAIAQSFNDNLQRTSSAGVFFGATAFGTIGIGIAYWLATLIGTPAYARAAVLGGSLVTGNGGKSGA